MGVSDYLEALRRHRLAIVLATVAGLLLGLGASVLTRTSSEQPALSSSATVQAVLLSEAGIDELEERVRAKTDAVAVASAEGQPRTRTALYAELMQSPTVIDQVASTLMIDFDTATAVLDVTASDAGLMLIRARAAEADIAVRAIKEAVRATNSRVTQGAEGKSTVRLVGQPVVVQPARTPLTDAPLRDASRQITRELLSEDAALYTASALDLSDRLTPEMLDRIAAALNEEGTAAGFAERLTWGGAADPSASADPAPGTELSLSVVAMDEAGALRAATATLDAVDAELTRDRGTLSPLVRLGATTTTVAAVSPSPDRTLTNVILGILIGLAAGVGYAFFRESRDPRIRGGRQLAQFTGVPPIGLIHEPPTPNDFQELRSNLLFGHAQVRTVAITSPESDDGRWTVARGLAKALADVERSAVIVDSDLPYAAHGAGDKRLGLAQILDGTTTLAHALQTTEVPRVSFLPAGEPHDDPGDLISRPKFVATLQELAEQFDYVLSVTGPLVDGAEAAIASHCADAALVLVRAGHTTGIHLDEAANRLMQVDAKVLGIVVTGVPAEDEARWSLRYFQPAQD